MQVPAFYQTRQTRRNDDYAYPTVKPKPKPEVRKVTIMTRPLWCDIDDPETNAHGQAGHPFSDSDPDKHHFSETKTVSVRTGDAYGRSTYQDRQEVTTEVDMCGYHWQQRNPFRAPAAVAGEIAED